MGWGSGTEVAYSLVSLAEKYVPEKYWYEFLLQGFSALQDQDWDCTGDMCNYHGKSRHAVLRVLDTIHSTDEFTENDAKGYS